MGLFMRWPRRIRQRWKSQSRREGEKARRNLMFVVCGTFSFFSVNGIGI